MRTASKISASPILNLLYAPLRPIPYCVILTITARTLGWTVCQSIQRLGRLLFTEVPAREVAPDPTDRVLDQLPDGGVGQGAATIERSVAESYAAGFREVMLTWAGLALASALSAAYFIQGGPSPVPSLESPGSTSPVADPQSQWV